MLEVGRPAKKRRTVTMKNTSPSTSMRYRKAVQDRERLGKEEDD